MTAKTFIIILTIFVFVLFVLAWRHIIRLQPDDPLENDVREIQPPLMEWARIFGGRAADTGRSVKQTFDGGFIITGTTDSFGAGSTDVWLIKLDSEGGRQWHRTFGGEERDVGHSVQQTADGGFIITGATESFGIASTDLWLIKTNLRGEKEWQRTFSGTFPADRDRNIDIGHYVYQTIDGGYIITGKTFRPGGVPSLLIIKTNPKGEEEWRQVLGGGWREHAVGHSIQQTLDGGYIIAGETETRGGRGRPDHRDVWLIKINPEGAIEWSQRFGGEKWDIGYSVQQTLDGGFIITGKTASFGAGAADIWLIKTDSKGEKIWDKTFGGEGWDTGYSVQQTVDKGFIIGGGTASFGAGERDIWLIKTDSKGEKIWDKTFGGEGWDTGYSVQQTVDKGYIIAGETVPLGLGLPNFWIIKTGQERIENEDKQEKQEKENEQENKQD